MRAADVDTLLVCVSWSTFGPFLFWGIFDQGVAVELAKEITYIDRKIANT